MTSRAIFKPACGRRSALLLVCFWPGQRVSWWQVFSRRWLYGL